MTDITRFLEHLGVSDHEISLKIHPCDEVFLHGKEMFLGSEPTAQLEYFLFGHEFVSLIDGILRWRGQHFDEISSVLDVGSGFGRTTRHLVSRIDPSRITIVEIQPEAVQFQTEEFGVQGVLSADDPAKVELAGRYELILAVSLFSHLPADSFQRWLTTLVELLTPRGVLVFSTIGPSTLDAGKDIPESGLRFEHRSESKRLAPERYGSTFVTEEYVASLLGTKASMRRFPRALGGYQDVYVVTTDQSMNLGTLTFATKPYGHIDGVVPTGGSIVELKGWATAGLADDHVTEVRAILNGEVSIAVPRFHPRYDVAAVTGLDPKSVVEWTLELELPGDRSWNENILVVEVRTTTATNPIFVGTIEYALIRTLGELKRKIEAMQASRFWRVRNLWFALKRRLGLTKEW